MALTAYPSLLGARGRSASTFAILNVTGVTTLSFGPLAMLDVVEVTCHFDHYTNRSLGGHFHDSVDKIPDACVAAPILVGLSFHTGRAIETIGYRPTNLPSIGARYCVEAPPKGLGVWRLTDVRPTIRTAFEIALIIKARAICASCSSGNPNVTTSSSYSFQTLNSANPPSPMLVSTGVSRYRIDGNLRYQRPDRVHPQNQ
jgi:hypothetical protein